MDETYRMLGREHQADLEREAPKWQRAAELRVRRGAPALAPGLVRHRRLIVVVPRMVAALLAVVASVGPVCSASGASTTSKDSLARAATIQTQVDARYPGLRVTEASSTAVIDSVTLFTAEADPRVVPAANGIYYGVCPIRATCPYPGRGASRPSAAFAPRRLALELAVRTFLETDADLVLVSLPTPRFVLLVFERAYVDASSISEATANGRPASAEVRKVVDSITLPLLFEPFALERCANGRDTLLALSIQAGRPPGT
jgi:hypothetical protein